MTRVALVTGGGTGIGRAAALALAVDGNAVAVTGRRPQPLAETVAAVEAAGGQALAAPGDQSRPEDAERVVRAAVQAFGGLHVVVNNAGTIRRNVRLHEVPIERWDEQIASNLRGPYLVLRAALPEMLRAEGDRSIVNVASTLAVKPAPGIAPYAAAKGGCIAMARQAAVDYGPHGIRVNVVAPGTVPTPLVRDTYAAGAGSGAGLDLEAAVDRVASVYPARRLGTEEEVAAMALHLCSDESRWTTGQVFTVDGGITAALPQPGS